MHPQCCSITDTIGDSLEASTCDPTPSWMNATRDSGNCKSLHFDKFDVIAHFPLTLPMLQFEQLLLTLPYPSPTSSKYIQSCDWNLYTICVTISDYHSYSVAYYSNACKYIEQKFLHSSAGRRFNRNFFVLSFVLKNGLRFHFDSETCQNYQCLNIVLV